MFKQKKKMKITTKQENDSFKANHYLLKIISLSSNKNMKNKKENKETRKTHFFKYNHYLQKNHIIISQQINKKKQEEEKKKKKKKFIYSPSNNNNPNQSIWMEKTRQRCCWLQLLLHSMKNVCTELFQPIVVFHQSMKVHTRQSAGHTT